MFVGDVSDKMASHRHSRLRSPRCRLFFLHCRDCLPSRVNGYLASHKNSAPNMKTSVPALSSFASGLTAETAFDVLAVARKLMAGGKDVIALQIGDSPFPTT